MEQKFRQTMPRLFLVALVALGMVILSTISGYFLSRLLSPAFCPPRPVTTEKAAPSPKVVCPPATSVPSEASPSPELTRVFVNDTYRYSFRYPSELSVRSDRGDREVALIAEDVPILTFSIVTLEDEREAVESAVGGLKFFPNLQQGILDALAKGQYPPEGGIEFPSLLKPFWNHGSADPLNKLGIAAIGLHLEGPFGKGIFIRLQKGHVLRVVQEWEYGWLAPVYDRYEQTIKAVLDTINPFL